MEDIKTQKKSRFVKGSDEAKTFMKNLRDKKKGDMTKDKVDCTECKPTLIKPKLIKNNKNIIVDL